MKNNSTIRLVLASLLLGIFLLGITPRQILHDIFTDHNHSVEIGGEESGISSSGFQCDSKSVVAKSSFIETYLVLPGLGQWLYGIQIGEPLRSTPHKDTQNQQQLRGPPAFS